MNKNIRILTYTLLAIGIVAIIVLIGANIFIKSKLETFINEDLPKNMIRSYDDLSVNTLNGTVLLTHPSLVIRNEEDSIKHTFFQAEKIVVSGMSYWDYIFKNEIHITNVTLNKPSYKYYKDKAISTTDSVPDKIQIKNKVFLNGLQVNNSEITLYEKGKDSTKMYAENLSFTVNNIKVNQETIDNKIPFEYSDVRASGDSIFVKASAYDNLSVADFSIKNNSIILNGLKYYTKYNRAELSRIVEVERDHYDLSIESVSINDFNYGFKDTVFFAKSKLISLNVPSLNIFRDKLVVDDQSIKPLYSKSLRELPFELTVDSMKVKDGFLKYTEKVQEENHGGSILFHDLNADISNVSNTYKNPQKTNINIEAVFMDKTPLSVDWSFDVQNTRDQFVFRASVGELEAEKMNRFTEPNLKVKLQGRANKTYFTIDGNNESSVTDLKINYSDFKIELLRKEGEKKNKFLSALINIFVSKDSERKDENYKEATGETARDKTKSVFNFLWISIQSALQKIMI